MHVFRRGARHIKAVHIVYTVGNQEFHVVAESPSAYTEDTVVFCP